MRSSRTRRPLQHQAAEHTEQPFFSKKQEDAKKKDDAFFQAKLAVGEKGDKFEQQADAVADKVQKKTEEEKEKPVQKKEEEKKEPGIQKMDKKEEEKPAQKKGAPDEKDKEKTQVNKKEEEKKEPGIQKMGKKEEEKPVQKKGAPDEKDKEKTQVNKKEEEKQEPGIQKMGKKEEEKPVQKMSDADKKEEKPVQKQEEQVMTAGKGGGSHATPKASVEEQIKQSKGKGQPLPDDVRALLESQLKVDLGQVRVHTGADAVAMNKELNALAFANGFDVYFNEGMYQPGTAAGKSLLAHEVTHVIQQTGISQKPAEKPKEKEKEKK